jgi:hypothetical protein
MVKIEEERYSQIFSGRGVIQTKSGGDGDRVGSCE